MPIGSQGTRYIKIGHMMRSGKFHASLWAHLVPHVQSSRPNQVVSRAFVEASKSEFGYAEVQDVTQPAGQDNVNDKAESFWGGELSNLSVEHSIVSNLAKTLFCPAS